MRWDHEDSNMDLRHLDFTKGMSLNREKSIVEFFKSLIPPDWTRLHVELWLLTHIIYIGIRIKANLHLLWHSLHVENSQHYRDEYPCLPPRQLRTKPFSRAPAEEDKMLRGVTIELSVPAVIGTEHPPEGPIGTRLLLEVSIWPR